MFSQLQNPYLNSASLLRRSSVSPVRKGIRLQIIGKAKTQSPGKKNLKVTIDRVQMVKDSLEPRANCWLSQPGAWSGHMEQLVCPLLTFFWYSVNQEEPSTHMSQSWGKELGSALRGSAHLDRCVCIKLYGLPCVYFLFTCGREASLWIYVQVCVCRYAHLGVKYFLV